MTKEMAKLNISSEIRSKAQTFADEIEMLDDESDTDSDVSEFDGDLVELDEYFDNLEFSIHNCESEFEVSSLSRKKIANESVFKHVDMKIDEFEFETNCYSALEQLENNAKYLHDPALSPIKNLIPENSEKHIAFLFGIDHYQNMDTLKTSEFDCMLLKNRLLDQGYDVCMLLNEQCTRDNILSLFMSLQDRFISSKQNFVFHFSGHGKEKMICLHDFDDNSPDDQSTFLSHEDLLIWLPKNVSHTLLSLDCCYSGSIESLVSNQFMKHMLPPSQNIHVVCSTHTDVAVEDNYNGLFTASLCKALRLVSNSNSENPNIPFSALFQLIYHEVTTKSEAFTGCIQKPTLVPICFSRDSNPNPFHFSSARKLKSQLCC